jgi:anti-anti-sigma factor
LPSATNGRTEASTTLPLGATLLLYTDGLIERRDAILDDGLRRLAAVAEPCRALPLPALLDRVLDELGHGAGAGDDIAVVALRILPEPLRIDLPARPDQLAVIRQQVREWSARAGLDQSKATDLQLAVSEATGNAAEHAYRGAKQPGRVQVDLDAEADGAVRVRVADQGVWRPPPPDPGLRGRGLKFIRALADEVNIDGDEAGTLVSFRLAASPPPASQTGTADQPPLSQLDPVEQPATLHVHDAEGRRWIRLSGALDLAAVMSLRSAVLDALACDEPVVLDCLAVRWLASVGVGLLAEAMQEAAKRGGAELRLPANGPARRLLDLTGLTDVPAITHDRTASSVTDT